MSTLDLPFVSIILPAKNEERYIGSALEGLAHQDYPADLMEVIVVDNNSTDGTAEICKQYNVKRIPFDHGPVGAVRNHGFKNSRGEIIFFLDSDCIAPTSWVGNAVKKLKENNDLILGGGCCLRENPYFLERYWLLSSRSGTTLPKDLIGASISMHRGVFEKVGMFSEEVTSGEDTELSQKLIEHGHNVLIDDQMSVVHLGNPITVRDFFKRQIWHSENYFQNIERSLKDPTFFLCFIFLLLTLAFLFFLLFGYTKYSIAFLIISLTIPAIFSIKRIKRSGLHGNLINFSAIYCLDSLYVSGRSVGILKSLRKKLIRARN